MAKGKTISKPDASQDLTGPAAEIPNLLRVEIHQAANDMAELKKLANYVKYRDPFVEYKDQALSLVFAHMLRINPRPAIAFFNTYIVTVGIKKNCPELMAAITQASAVNSPAPTVIEVTKPEQSKYQAISDNIDVITQSGDLEKIKFAANVLLRLLPDADARKKCFRFMIKSMALVNWRGAKEYIDELLQKPSPIIDAEFLHGEKKWLETWHHEIPIPKSVDGNNTTNNGSAAAAPSRNVPPQPVLKPVIVPVATAPQNHLAQNIPSVAVPPQDPPEAAATDRVLATKIPPSNPPPKDEPDTDLSMIDREIDEDETDLGTDSVGADEIPKPDVKKPVVNANPFSEQAKQMNAALNDWRDQLGRGDAAGPSKKISAMFDEWEKTDPHGLRKYLDYAIVEYAVDDETLIKSQPIAEFLCRKIIFFIRSQESESPVIQLNSLSHVLKFNRYCGDDIRVAAAEYAMELCAAIEQADPMLYDQTMRSLHFNMAGFPDMQNRIAQILQDKNWIPEKVVDQINWPPPPALIEIESTAPPKKRRKTQTPPPAKTRRARGAR